MSEYPHDERNDFATYSPTDTFSEHLDDDLQALHDDELDDFALSGGDEPNADVDALDAEWEDHRAVVIGAGSDSNDRRTIDARRAIERLRERQALRDMLADGYADSWDKFDTSGTGH